MFPYRPDLASDIIWLVAVAALWVLGAIIWLFVVLAIMCLGRLGFQEAATRLQTWQERVREPLGRALVITSAIALAVLLACIGVRIFS